MHFISIFLLFFFSSLYVLILDYLAFSQRSLQQAFTAILLTVFFLIYRYHFHSWRGLNTPEGKFFFLFLGTILIQLLVLSTGGLQSPFFILIHLCMVMISFVFNFSIGLLFLLFCLLAILVDFSFSQTFFSIIENNLNATLLQFISLLVIIPISYLVSRQYHMKAALVQFLQTRVQTTEKILKSLPELIIVTNASFRILSVNDIAVKTLQRSQSELLNKPLFDILFLKDTHGNVVTAKTFFPQEKVTNNPQNTQGIFTLMTALPPERFITIQVKPVRVTEGEDAQISFIINFTPTTIQSIDKARTRYEASLKTIKNALRGEPKKLQRDLMLLEKIEEDTYNLQTFEAGKTTLTKIDIAKLAEQIVHLNQDFADAFYIKTQFILPNFGKEDIKPLTIANYPVNPKQLTGPFFTVTCDAQKIELAIKKLLDLSILLSSTLAKDKQKKEILVTVERAQNQSLLITFRGDCPPLSKNELQDLFVPYYPKLEEKTNLRIGSGLEGLLLKKIIDLLGLSLSINYDDVSSQVFFILSIPRKPRKK